MPKTNMGFSFVTLKPWDQRKEEHLKSPALVTEILALNDRIKDGVVFGAPPPPIEGLSSTGGFEAFRSEEQTSELQSLMRISYAVFCLKKKTRIVAIAERTQ